MTAVACPSCAREFPSRHARASHQNDVHPELRGYREPCSIEGCGRVNHSGGLCNRHDLRLKRHGDPLGGRAAYGPLRDRWNACVPYRGDGCWEWQGVRLKTSGYGRIGGVGRSLQAHRVGWQLLRGPIPAGLHVLHHCDNPPCVNPDHLYLGTPADNARDRVERMRGNHGSRNGMARLTEADVVCIRRDSTMGMSQGAIARKHVIAQVTVNVIVNRRRWKHVA